MVAPAFVFYQVKLVIHLTVDEGTSALDYLAALDVIVVPDTHDRCRAAYAWANRLRQARAYDGLYLALIEELDAHFCTGDKRLATAGQRLGVAWIDWVGDGT